MLSILLAVILGLGVGYFAIENTAPVALRVGDLVLENVPLYLVAVGSLLAGLVIGWIFFFARSLSNSLLVFGKERDTGKVERGMADLEYRVRELEAANAQLRIERSSDTRMSAAA
jgi:hypothetical protein